MLLDVAGGWFMSLQHLYWSIKAQNVKKPNIFSLKAAASWFNQQQVCALNKKRIAHPTQHFAQLR